MRTVIGLGIFVGTGQCNANCEHCAGTPHRKNAHKFDGEIDKELIEDVIRKCYSSGAKYISLTSSGEPTLSPGSVTKVLELIKNYEFVKYDKINLYTNGIVIGSDLNFCKKYFVISNSL